MPRALVTAVLLCCFAGSALAADPAEDARVREATELIKKFSDLTEAKDKAAIERTLPRLVKLHNQLKTAAVRVKLIKSAASMMGAKRLGGTRMAVADTVAKLNDPKAVYKEIKRFLPPVKEEAAGPFPLRVVQTVGTLAPEAALPSLLRLMDKAKDRNVSRYAIQALGKYGWSRQRTKVLSELLTFLKKLRPGGSDLKKGRAGGEAARVRYEFLRQTIVVALDELTGQKMADVDKWLAAYKSHKKKLSKLFTFDR